ncbi:MAG: hypothetical protein ACQSGP_14015 [Frankia sp.]
MSGDLVDPAAPTVSPVPSRWRGRLGAATANPAGSIYGTIIATSVIAIEASTSTSLAELISTDLTTVLVYWLAHVYASFVVSDQRLDRRRGRRRLGSIMVHEWSMVAGSFLPLLAVLIAGLFTADLSTAVTAGLWAGVALLYGWGYAASRAGGRGRLRSLSFGLVGALFGMSIVIMRVLLH